MVLLAAIIIPGGLLVYFAWAAVKAKQDKPQKAKPTPEEAREDFREMFPEGSLRAQSRKKQLIRARAFRRKDSEYDL